MPDYSEYIIKENDKVEIFANYRGDYTFISDIFLGPILTKEFIKRQTKLASTKGDNAFSAIVLDFDNKELLLEIDQGEEEDGSGIFATVIILKLLEIRYPNWIIKYAVNGISDRQKYIPNSKFKESSEAIIRYNEMYGYDEPRGTLISIQKGKEKEVYWNELSLYEIIPKGANFLLNPKNQNSIPENRFPFGGIHVNLSDNNMFFWYFSPTPFAKKWANQYWKDFKVIFLFNGYRNHFELLEQSKFSDVINSGIAKAFDVLKESIVYSYEQHSKISSSNERYDSELKIMNSSERLKIFKKAINELNKNGLQQFV